MSSQQALADVAQFIQWMIDTWDGVNENTQFVTFGCSYPGNLAAWFRLKYPQHTSGSVAGSSPVHAVLDFFQYLDVVDESLSMYIVFVFFILSYFFSYFCIINSCFHWY